MSHNSGRPAIYYPLNRLRTTIVICGALALSLSACTVTGLSDEDRDALVGLWQHTTPGELQLSIEILDDGTWNEVDADLGAQECSTARGVWTEAAGVITATETERNGVPVSGAVEVFPYTVSGNTLTFDPTGDEPEAFSAIDALPTCSDYGWPTLTMSVGADSRLGAEKFRRA